MKRSLLIAAFLGTTALTPTQAHAAPVVGFVAGIASAISGFTVGASLAGFGTGFAFASSAVGGFIVKAGIAIGLAAISASLAPSPTLPPPSARMVNFAQPKAYAEYVFGRTRKGGPIGFTGFANNRRYYVPILAAHEIAGVHEHWLDEWPVEVKSEPNVNEPNVDTSPLKQWARIDLFTGGAGQVADPGLMARFSEITAAHDFKGLAGAVVWAKRPPQNDYSTIYPRGREWAYTPVVDGNNQIFDPRTSTTGYSNNAALCMAWWITEVLGREVDWDEVAEEADACDVTVVNGDGLPQRKWTINGVISDEMDFEGQRGQMAAACDAFFYERADGKVGFKVGRWIEPELTLGADDFFGMEITSGTWGQADQVQATYIEPGNAWRETPAGAWVQVASNDPTREEPQLFLVNNHNQACRIEKRIARVNHAEYRLNGTLGVIGYELIGQRFFRVQHPEMGIDEVFEIGRLTREGPGAFTITANSVKEEDFAFTAAIEEPDRPEYSSVEDDGSIAAITGLTGGAVGDGTIRLLWDQPDPAYVQYVKYRPASAPPADNDALPTTTESVDTILVPGLQDGVTYRFEVRNILPGIDGGDWSVVNVQNVANTTAPVALTDFLASAVDDEVTIAFTAPNDANYFGTNIYRGTTASFGAATLIHTEYGIPSDGDSHTDSPGIGTFYYWGAPINASSVEGPVSGPESVTTTSP